MKVVMSKVERAHSRMLNKFRGIESRFTRVGNANVHYLTAGNKGPSVMLIHGTGSAGAWEWMHVIRPLSDHFTVYAPDLVGVGLTDKPIADYSLSYVVSFLESFMDTMQLGRSA